MEFNVAQLLKSPVGTRRDYELEEDIGDLDHDVRATQPLTGQVRFTRTASGILATGRMHTVVEIECRRCLRVFSTPVDFDLEEEFVPMIDVTTGLKLVNTDVEEALLIDERHMLNLSEVVRQYLILYREQYPLCSEACAGLCPVCGQNLNEGPCGCQDASEDPRWAALRELLE
ncbi:MAG TPA: DUF177 domain-containing protein [Anaerolineae bacterium]|nr:DUF177 domain-containing protein [Anaerolineae bacterium]HOR01532.1 DUF177 domain-containing protein [Anaerolineae bacterium]HPL28644.1 DUF177 domain-containing protein [Anaerolineae bacterium]